MKKIILILLTVILTCQIHAQKNNTPYDFPIKPGSAEWASISTVEETYNVCQIPSDILSNLTTKALIQTCLNYPFNSILFIWNTPQQGFNSWRQHFNGIDALFSRLDACEELINVYSTSDILVSDKSKSDKEKFINKLQIKMLEGIIVQDEILVKLNQSQQKRLLKLCLSNLQLIETDNVNNISNLISTGRIILKLSNKLGNQNLKIKIKSKEIQDFLNTGLLIESEEFIQLIDDAKSINTNNP